MVESAEETGRRLGMQPGMQAPYSLEMGSFPHFCKSLPWPCANWLWVGQLHGGVAGDHGGHCQEPWGLPDLLGTLLL